MSLSPIGDLGIALKADVDDYQKSMATASDVTSGFTGILQGVISGVRNLGVVMTAASAATGAAMTSMAMSAARVNEAFREVDTISSIASSAQEEYGEVVSDLNTEMGVNADRLTVIDALYQSVSAGVQQGEEAQREFLETAARLSVVGRVDLATTVDILSTAINGYSKSTEFAQRASDALFQTVQFGKTTMEELAPVMGRVIALGSEMEASIEGLGAAMAVLTRTGFTTRVAATGLRAVLRGLLRPSEDLQMVLRDIALEQNLFANSLDENSEQIRKIAEDYKSATDSLQEWETAQRRARDAVESTSLKIQEARLLQQAIEQGRREEVEETIKTEELQGATLSELESQIEEYRLEVNQARVEEERARQEKEELQEEVSDLEQEFKNQLATSGDLQGSIGQLVVQEEGFVNTLVQVREKANEQNIAMSDLFNRTRALQASLAILGDDGKELTKIFQAMGQDEDELNEQLEETQKQFDLTDEQIEDLRDNVQSVREEYEETQGATQSLNDVTSELREAYQDLGQMFIGVVVNNAERLANFAENLVNKFEKMDESVRQNIARFMALAVGIGLVLGPLLILGSQIALLVTSLAVGFIPILGTAAVAIGGLASSFRTILKDGADAETLLKAMQSVFNRLKSFAITLKDVFLQDVLPGMETFSEGVITVFKEVVDVFADEGADAEGTVEKLGQIIGDIFEFIGQTLLDNKDEIASFFQDVAEFIVDDFVPAITDTVPKIAGLIEKFNALASDEKSEVFEQFSDDFAKIVVAVKDTIEAIQEYNKENEDVDVTLRNIIDTILELDKEVLIGLSRTLRRTIVSVLNFVQAFVRFASRDDVQNFISDLASLVRWTYIQFREAQKSLNNLKTTVNGIFGPFIDFKDVLKVLSVAVLIPLTLTLATFVTLLSIAGGFAKTLKTIFDGLNTVLSVLGWIVGALVVPFFEDLRNSLQDLKNESGPVQDSVKDLLNEFKNLVSYIDENAINSFEDLVVLASILKNIYKEIKDIIAGLPKIILEQTEDMVSAGETLMKKLAKGIRNGIEKHVKGAASDAADAVTKHFPNSPKAEVGPLSDTPMDKSGKTMMSNLATGIGNDKNVVDSIKKLNERVNDNIDTEKKIGVDIPDENTQQWLKDGKLPEVKEGRTTPSTSSSTSSEGRSDEMQKVIIDEKAVFFEAGAFQGVSDEELPTKVRDVVDASMEEIVEALEAKGVEFE